MTTNADQSIPVLELRDVHKTFKNDVFKKQKKVISGLTCQFRKGLCTGLLGHNGAGKTTTIRLILGLIRPDRGEILANGAHLSTRDRRHIGYMPEVNKLPAGLTPREILTYQLRLFSRAELPAKTIRELVNQKLIEVGLGAHGNIRVSRLSKGLGRRLGWAQATIHEPSLVILDEPFSGLDPLGRQSMHEWILNLKQKGTSIVLCTHELMNTETLCDDFVVLQRGHLVYRHEHGLADAADGKADEPAFEIAVSGLTTDALRDFASRQKLEAPRHISEQGYLINFSIGNQAASQRWLAALVTSGYVIMRCGENVTARTNYLLKYFEGGDL